jgi:hypothetical protein
MRPGFHEFPRRKKAPSGTDHTSGADGTLTDRRYEEDGVEVVHAFDREL